MPEESFLLFLHSLVRWLVLASVATAVFVNWRGLLLKTPIIIWERMVTILAMVVCHVQLVIGVLLYVIDYRAITRGYTGEALRYWKYEHLGVMLSAIVLITLGRILSKRARAEGAKQLLVAVFYSAGLLIMLWSIPWPFTFLGMGRGYL